MIRVERTLGPIPLWAVSLVAVSLVALAARRVGPAAPVVVVLVGAGALAASLPQAEEGASARRWLAVAVLGTAAMAAVALGSRTYSVPWYPMGAAAAVAAAMAEEAFFRRFLYGWLLRWGALVAVVATAAAFAAVHVPMYGVGTLALNTAAGLLFGWQRWAAGTWTAPAATHAAANLLAFL
jgi:membrane protease YdiL (CAAX protease family)